MTIMFQSYDYEHYSVIRLLRKEFGDTPFRISRRVVVDRLPSDQKVVELMAYPIWGFQHELESARHYYFKVDATTFVELESYATSIDISVFSSTMELLSAMDVVEARLKPLETKATERETKIDFINMDGDRVAHRPGVVEALPWKEIRNNYVEKNRLALDRLLTLEEPWKRGKLLLIHGTPGTGKTTFIRTLMQVWRDRFSPVVVADPERFTADVDYYFRACSQIARGEEGFVAKETGPRQNLFIMEDCADLVMPESRQIHFDKMGKFLSMTDGLFGQGRRDLFVLTFNEEIDRIDAAFTRPGRCLANIKLESFDAGEQVRWLEEHGIDPAIIKQDKHFLGSERSLAELYELYHIHRKEKA